MQADRHQLHDFTRIIFIGDAAAGFLLVAYRRQIGAHHRMQRYGFEQGAVIAEGVGRQHVVVGRYAARIVGDVAVLKRDDEYLGQCKGDALAQLIVAGDRLFPERFKKFILGDDRARGQRRADAVHVGAVQGLRLGELIVYPDAGAGSCHLVDRCGGRAERRLREEARRLGLGDRHIVAGGCSGAGVRAAAA